MTNTQQRFATPVVPQNFEAEPLRDLTVAELEQVAGGAPHGTWKTAGDAAAVTSVPTPAPHGKW